MKARRTEITWHPGLSIYASETLLKLVGDDYGWIEGIDEAGKRRCILPYSIIKKPLIKMARFRVETIPVGEELSLVEEKEFLNSAVAYLRGIGADMIIPATTNSIFRTYPDGAVAAPYGTFIVDLSQPEEKLWGNMHSNHRNKVRSAMKNGIDIRTGMEYLDAAYDIICGTLGRSHSHFIKHEEFERFVRGLKENLEILVACHQDTVQGCVVVPFSAHSAYFLYSGRSASAATGAMNLLKWESMLHFRRLGVHYFNFVGVRVDPEKGSKQEGLLNSKKRFGGRYVQGYIWKYPISRLKYTVYCQAVRVRRRGDIVDQERNKLDFSE
jgi:hypothetical protein